MLYEGTSIWANIFYQNFKHLLTITGYKIIFSNTFFPELPIARDYMTFHGYAQWSFEDQPEARGFFR